MLEQVITLEEDVAMLLPSDRWASSPTADYVAARDRWTEAVWDAGERLGSHIPDADTSAQGVALSQRIVFVCGLHRSGTTLLRDLLDTHPELSVLPSEGSYFTNLFSRLQRMPEAQVDHFMAREWAGRLANPVNQAPFWTLGRTTEQISPYVNFVRWLEPWRNQLLMAGIAPAITPHLAVLLAFTTTQREGLLDGRTHWLVEKTPTNELHSDRWLDAIPGARMIQVVRHPYSIYASRKRIEEKAGGSFRSAGSLLRTMDRSFRIAADAPVRDPRHLIVRFEDLLTAPRNVMGNVARFLGVDPSAMSIVPTVGGQETAANTSFEAQPVAGSIRSDFADRSSELTDAERSAIAAMVGTNASKLGYNFRGSNLFAKNLTRLKIALLRRP